MLTAIAKSLKLSNYYLIYGMCMHVFDALSILYSLMNKCNKYIYFNIFI